MENTLPKLDFKAVKDLRRVVKSIKWKGRNSIPMAELVELPSLLPDGSALTVDVGASAELGGEMIVLRVPVLRPAEKHACLPNLSDRENEVVCQIALGLSNKEIAELLFISVATVKTHVHNILKKTGCGNRTAIALLTKQS